MEVYLGSGWCVRVSDRKLKVTTDQIREGFTRREAPEEALRRGGRAAGLGCALGGVRPQIRSASERRKWTLLNRRKSLSRSSPITLGSA